MKKTTLKTLLLLLVMLTGVSNAWSAGYNRTLTEDLEVSGYKLKAFYDFQNNSPEVLPTSGDLRYRPYEKGGYWGLHNYGSGGRSGTATISVAEGDILIVQNYSGTTSTTINRGSINETLTSSTGYQVFNITSTADDITFTAPRGNGIVAALVMEKDASVATADFTINYVYNGETIQTSTGNAPVGDEITADSPIYVENVKYFIEDGETISMTLVAEAASNVLNVNLRVANTYSYTLNATNGADVDFGELASGSDYEGNVVTIPFSQFILDGTTLYGIANNSSDWYRETFTLTEDNFTKTLEYNKSVTENVVFFTEAENIEGLTTAGSYPNRASNGIIAYTQSGGTDYIYKPVTTLEPGKYQIFVRGLNGNAASRALKFKANGTEVFAFDIANGTNQTGNSEEFSLGDTSELTFTCEGSSSSGLDWLYIVKTGDVDVTPYTVKYVSTEGNELKESTTHTGFSGEAITLAETVKETIWVDDVKYIYASDDSEGKTAVEGTVVTITFRVAENKPYTIVAVDAEGTTVATVAESTVTEGETTSATFSKYVQGTDGTWYELAAPYKMDIVEGENKVVCTAATADFDYFYEAEGLKTTRSAATSSSSTSLSNSYGFGMYAGEALYTKETVPAGVYTIYASGLSRRSGSTNIKLNLRDAAGNEIETGKTLTWTNADKEAVEMTAEGVEVPEGFSLSLHEATGYNSVTYLDYITLKKTADFSGKVEYYGDANGDGSVDISDVVAVVNYILNGGATGTFASENADVNADGAVDISDVVGVVNMILNGEVKPRAVVAE